MEHFIRDGFAVPPGTEISISHTGFDSKIIIGKPDVFEFEIEFQVSNYGPHPPTGHPVNLQNPRQVESADILIHFDAEFDFPDNRDSEYEKHRQYAESIVEVLREGGMQSTSMSSYRIESCTRLNPNSTKYEVG